MGVLMGTLTQQVAQELGQRTVRGDYLPGDALPSEADLSVELEVSRTVVREALKVLAVAVNLAGDRQALLFLESSNRATGLGAHRPVDTPAIESPPGKRSLHRPGAVKLGGIAPTIALIVGRPVVTVTVVRIITVVIPSPSWVPIPSPPRIPVKGKSGSVTVIIPTMVKKASAAEPTSMPAAAMPIAATTAAMPAAATASTTPSAPATATVSLYVRLRCYQSNGNQACKEKVQFHNSIASVPTISTSSLTVPMKSMPAKSLRRSSIWPIALRQTRLDRK